MTELKNVFEALETRLQDLKNDIAFKNYEINNLKAKLAEAEKELAELKGAK